MTEAAFWWAHTVSVEPLLIDETGAQSQRYGDPVSVDCWIETEPGFFHDPKGEGVASSATLYGPIDSQVSFPAGSRVTMPTDTIQYVINTRRLDSGSLDLELDHVEVYLTLDESQALS